MLKKLSFQEDNIVTFKMLGVENCAQIYPFLQSLMKFDDMFYTVVKGIALVK